MPLVVKNYKLHAPSTKFRMTVIRVKIDVSRATIKC